MDISGPGIYGHIWTSQGRHIWAYMDISQGPYLPIRELNAAGSNRLDSDYMSTTTNEYYRCELQFLLHIYIHMEVKSERIHRTYIYITYMEVILYLDILTQPPSMLAHLYRKEILQRVYACEYFTKGVKNKVQEKESQVSE